MDAALIDRTLAPRAALERLVHATGGRAAPELVSILAFDVRGPWCSARVGRLAERDQPRDPGALAGIFDQLPLGPPLPAATGPLAWLRHFRLARPIDELGRVPGWLTADELQAAWVPLPPTGWPADHDDIGSALQFDGRLVAIAALMACAGDHVDEATRAAWSLVNWCAGPQRAMWSESAGQECRARKVDWGAPGPWAWFQRASMADVDALTDALPGAAVPADWAHVPTQAELAAQAERERITEQGRRDLEAWNARPAPTSGPPEPFTNTAVMARLSAGRHG